MEFNNLKELCESYTDLTLTNGKRIKLPYALGKKNVPRSIRYAIEEYVEEHNNVDPQEWANNNPTYTAVDALGLVYYVLNEASNYRLRYWLEGYGESILSYKHGINGEVFSGVKGKKYSNINDSIPGMVLFFTGGTIDDPVVGVIYEVSHDENGNVTSLKFATSIENEGPVKVSVETNGNKYFSSLNLPYNLEAKNAVWSRAFDDDNLNLYNGYCSIRKGDEGAMVNFLRECIIRTGLDIPITGAFDDSLENIVRKIQSENGMTVDGIVGQTTISLIAGQLPPRYELYNRGALAKMGFRSKMLVVSVLKSLSKYMRDDEFGLNTYERKLHFLAQVMAETMYGDTFIEKPYPNDSLDYYPYQGAGLLQLTHNFTYEAFYEYVKESLKIDDPFILWPKNNVTAYIADEYPILSACWFWSHYKKINTILTGTNDFSQAKVNEITNLVWGQGDINQERYGFLQTAVSIFQYYITFNYQVAGELEIGIASNGIGISYSTKADVTAEEIGIRNLILFESTSTGIWREIPVRDHYDYESDYYKGSVVYFKATLHKAYKVQAEHYYIYEGQEYTSFNETSAILYA